MILVRALVIRVKEILARVVVLVCEDLKDLFFSELIPYSMFRSCKLNINFTPRHSKTLNGVQVSHEAIGGSFGPTMSGQLAS